MKGCRRHPRGDIITGRKEPSLCSWSRHGEGGPGRKKREEGGSRVGRVGRSDRKSQAPFPLMILPEFACGAALDRSRYRFAGGCPGGSLTIRFITGDHLLAEISIALPERRHRRAMTDALPLRFPRIFIKTFLCSSRVLQGQLPWIARPILCFRSRKISSPGR